MSLEIATASWRFLADGGFFEVLGCEQAEGCVPVGLKRHIELEAAQLSKLDFKVAKLIELLISKDMLPGGLAFFSTPVELASSPGKNDIFNIDADQWS